MNISETLLALAECLCETIKNSNRPETCFCGVIPGEAAMQAYVGDCTGKNGMAWVRMANLYPSSAVGVADQTIGNCYAGTGADIELGIMRMVEVGDAQSYLPPDVLLRQALDQQTEAAILFQTVACCPAIDSKDYIIGAYLPMGPQGGMLGGSLTIHMGVD